MDYTLYTFNEIVALVAAVAIGSGAYISYVKTRKEQTINWGFVWPVLLINLFLTSVISEFLRIKDLGEYRTVVLPLVAYAGQYLTDWVDKRREKIFDALVGKTGVNLKQKDEEKHDFEDGSDS